VRDRSPTGKRVGSRCAESMREFAIASAMH
jgi:hypothetical protein